MEKIRLSKLMSEQGICSRREADRYIELGWVFVDGERISELGTKIFPTQKITLNKAAQAQQTGLVTILLNKPVGYVSGQPEPGYQPAVVLIKPENQFIPTGATGQALSARASEKSGARRAARYRFARLAGADAGWPHRQAIDR
jgi:23S rRNA pseudouridine2604 synthase